jgi:ATP-dependent phosphoenolpyruvate carboxykinase
VARLSQEQAIFFYLSGYAAKNPIGDPKAEPKAVFSAAFGETFMVQDPI